jgi:hypothetical protein
MRPQYDGEVSRKLSSAAMPNAARLSLGLWNRIHFLIEESALAKFNGSKASM